MIITNSKGKCIVFKLQYLLFPISFQIIFFRYVNYWKGVATDYKEALKELKQSCRQKPLKASIIGSAFISAW